MVNCGRWFAVSGWCLGMVVDDGGLVDGGWCMVDWGMVVRKKAVRG